MVQRAGDAGSLADLRHAMIPEFPHKREVTLDDKPLFDSIFAAKQPEISAYTFTNIFAWRGACATSVSLVGEHLLVLCDLDDSILCLEPLGKSDIRPAVEEAIRRVDRPVVFRRLSCDAAMQLEGSGLTIQSDPDNYDYVYSSEDLITLAGRAYDGKRNQIAHAKMSMEYDYIRMNADIAAECVDFARIWCEEKDCEGVEGLKYELHAVLEMLTNFDALGIAGGAIRANGAIVAFSLGEALNANTLVVHVEKADSRIDGLYQLINNEFCIAEAKAHKYVNREQDLGIPGLRKAKESYHPSQIIKTFRAFMA